MRILALDTGTHTGWAWWDGSRRESGVQVFDVKRGESPGMRFVRWNHWLDATLKWGPADPAVCGPELVVFEQAHHRGGAATQVGVGMTTRILEFCARHGIEHSAVHSATLKKFVLGYGRGDKAQMVSRVNERWGPPFVTDDNEADAIALLEYAKAELVPA